MEEVLGRLYFDLELERQTYFAHIPQAREHIRYPERILFDQIRELLSIPDRELTVATRIGDDVVTNDGLVFTGRVFVWKQVRPTIGAKLSNH